MELIVSKGVSNESIKGFLDSLGKEIGRIGKTIYQRLCKTL